MNTPNKITIARFALSLVMIVIFCLSFLPQSDVFAPKLGTTGFSWIDLVSATIFIVAAVTDSVDGHLARSRNIVTDFGKFLDPLADKFLVDSSLVLLSTRVDPYGNFYLFPLLTVLFIGRDLAVDGLRMVATTKGKVLAANKFGKLKTVLQMIVIPIVYLNGFPFNYLDFQGRGDFAYTNVVTNVLATIALIASLFSAAVYFAKNKDVLKQEKE